MKNKYIAPDFELIRLTLKDVILTSTNEMDIGDQWGDDSDDEFEIDGL